MRSETCVPVPDGGSRFYGQLWWPYAPENRDGSCERGSKVEKYVSYHSSFCLPASRALQDSEWQNSRTALLGAGGTVVNSHEHCF